MHEKDHLDEILESSLSSYGDPGAERGEPGLAERILARVESEERPRRAVPRWGGRFMLYAALPVAACLLLTFYVLKSPGPPVVRPSIQPPAVASVTPKLHPPGDRNATPRQVVRTRATSRTTVRPAVAASAARPKLDVFPLPKPLSPAEQALYAFATQVPEEQRQAILAAQKKDDAPLNVAALSIEPLEINATGKN